MAPARDRCPRQIEPLERPPTAAALLKCLFGLNREANGDFGRAVENLKQMVAKQAAILAPWSTYGNQFNAAVAGIAFGTGYGCAHRPVHLIFKYLFTRYQA